MTSVVHITSVLEFSSLDYGKDINWSTPVKLIIKLNSGTLPMDRNHQIKQIFEIILQDFSCFPLEQTLTYSNPYLTLYKPDM